MAHLASKDHLEPSQDKETETLSNESYLKTIVMDVRPLDINPKCAVTH